MTTVLLCLWLSRLLRKRPPSESINLGHLDWHCPVRLLGKEVDPD